MSSECKFQHRIGGEHEWKELKLKNTESLLMIDAVIKSKHPILLLTSLTVIEHI